MNNNVGWQDISTAPKDGTRFLGWNGEEIAIYEYVTDGPYGPGFCMPTVFITENGGGAGWYHSYPELTHFIALPQGPGEECPS